MKNFNCSLEATEHNLSVFDFHHKNPNEKERNAEWMRNDFDISKVILLCSNCHRLEHLEY